MDALIGRATFRVAAGTVTFLVADAPSRPPDGARVPGAGTFTVLEAAAGLHGGVRAIEREEDRIVLAFPRASDAVAAALDGLLAASRGPEDRPLRIAVHTADALARPDGRYFGHAVARCAALGAVAHPGQVLVARAARDLVLDSLPEGASLTDLGVHRLRDLGRAEHVFGLAHPELPGAFPPLRSLDVLPNNLPAGLTTFVGRLAERATAAGLLAGTRLLTLTGAGGCGKTRLALQVAADALDAYPDGVWWVDLARLDDPARLVTAVTGALRVHDLSGWSSIDVLVDHLRTRSALVVLDNCEHLLTACADLVETLLSTCPSVPVVATSRAPLGVAVETAWRVPSMSLPSPATGDAAPAPEAEPVEALRQSDAVRLFAERAALVQPGFTISAANAPAVAQICADLDGIPLAIELAAARLRMMSPEQIAAGVADRFHLLTGGSRTGLPRHRTLRASIDWSHDLLGGQERTLLRRLSVFAGGWTLDAAESVCSGDGIEPGMVLDLLTALVDRSLVSTVQRVDSVRYRLLETVRQYAAARLGAAGEAHAVRTRHLHWYAAFAERMQPAVMRSAVGESAVEQVSDEVPNLHAAIDWAAATETEEGLRITTALHLFWFFTGRYAEGDDAARALGDRPPEDLQGRDDGHGEGEVRVARAASIRRGHALAARAYLGLYGGRYAEAPLCAQEALRVGDRTGDDSLRARAAHVLGMVFGVIDPAAGRAYLQQAAELAAACGDDWCRIDALQFLAWTWIFVDEGDVAEGILEEADALITRVGYRWGRAMHWLAHSRITKLRGRLDDSEGVLEKMAAASDDVGDPVTRSMAAHAAAWVASARGRAETVREQVTGSLARVTQAQAGLVFGFANQSVGRVELALGNLPAARRHLELAVDADRGAIVYFVPEHLAMLGEVVRLQGDPDTALACGLESLDVARRIRSPWLLACAERLLSRLALDAGDVAAAERYAHEALARLVGKGLWLPVPDCLELLAAAGGRQGRHEEAARLLGAAASCRAGMRTVRVPAEPAFWDEVTAGAREALGSARYEAAVAAGSALGREEAVAYARRSRGERKRPSSGWESLTPTELEVARHVAAGLTNAEIGRRMFISRGTAKVHLSHIFAKLGMSTRAELAAEATRRGL